MNAPERLHFIWQGLLDVIYPPVCLICGERPREPFCEACRSAIQPLSPPFCPRCGSAAVPSGQKICAACEAGGEPPFQWLQAAGQYAGPLREAIHLLKYRGKTALAEPLGQMLIASCLSPGSRLHAIAGLAGFNRVVPVPLHPARWRQRGFNQSELLARVVMQERGWPVDTIGLRRTRRTTPQVGLSAGQRAANVQGAFAPRTPNHFAGQSVLLIDDVLTTTATVREAARALREAGATRVCVAALAQDL
ncbi:MAG: ComF family protein [Chloroherpetonaceae bacterium]|nr:ComF family protein [Chthonomonadaceae bacterium]MDW8207794.1 ComF family protein [Chloroherpetonaceae bacterium]